MNLLAGLSPALQGRLEQLKARLSPHTSRAYLVGGVVRDLVLGRCVHDLDVEVYDIAPDAFERLMGAWGAKGVGKSFFVYKWEGVDLSLPRTEEKIARGHRGFAVEVCQEERMASMRRDFTMNALMVNLFTGEVLDFWGGREDIGQKRIRLIDPHLFAQDPLRVLRGVRFAASLGFRIEEKTLEVMAALKLEELSQTRISWEMEKLFVAPFYAHGVLYMYRLGLFASVLGCTPSKTAVLRFARTLLRHKPYVLDHLRPYYWLFHGCYILGLKPKEVIAKLALPTHYGRMLLHVPYKEGPMSDYALVEVAFERPLRQWVGVCYKGRVQRAKELGVYEQPFRGPVSADALQQEGFFGKALGEELKKRTVVYAKSLYM